MEHKVKIIDTDYANNGDVIHTIEYGEFKLLATVSQSDFSENPFEEDLGEVIEIYYVNSTPDDYDTEDEFLEYESVPETFPMLYAGDVLIQFDTYAESSTHAFIDPLRSYENAKQVWGYTKSCEEFIAYIRKCMERYEQYYHGYWYYACLDLVLLDAEDQRMESYSESCGGYRSYYFDSYDENYGHGLDAIQDMAHGICVDYARKGDWKQGLLIPLEGL